VGDQERPTPRYGGEALLELGCSARETPAPLPIAQQFPVSVSYCGVTYRVLPDVHNDVVRHANRTYSFAATSYANLRPAWLEDRATRVRDSSARPGGNCAGQAEASCPVVPLASSSLQSGQ